MQAWLVMRDGIPGLWLPQRRGLVWGYALMHTAWTLLLILGAFLVAGGLLVWWWESTQWAGWRDWAWSLGKLGMGTVCLVSVWLVLWQVGLILLGGWLLTRLARRVLLDEGVPKEALEEVSVMGEGADALRETVWLLLHAVLALAMQLIPVAGPFMGMAYLFWHQARVLGLESLAYPLALQNMRLKQRHALARQTPGLSLGLGALPSLAAPIPVLGGLSRAASVVAASQWSARMAGGKCALSSTGKHQS